MRGRWIVVLLGAALAGPAHAGSYMRSEGQFAYSSSLGYIWATRQWDADGDPQDSSCRREYDYNSHYAEYGYSYYYTLFGGAQLAQAHCAQETSTGIGDLRLGVRGRTDLYRNHHAWEIVATIPTNSGSTESPRLGCRAFGLSGALSRKDDLLPTLALGSGIGVEWWEAPLASQVGADVSLSGPLNIRALRWGVDLTGHAPLERDGGAVGADVSDCGTRGKQIKTGVRLGWSASKVDHFECGYSRAVWGEDSTVSQGLSCGFSHLWD